MDLRKKPNNGLSERIPRIYCIHHGTGCQLDERPIALLEVNQEVISLHDGCGIVEEGFKLVKWDR